MKRLLRQLLFLSTATTVIVGLSSWASSIGNGGGTASMSQAGAYDSIPTCNAAASGKFYAIIDSPINGAVCNGSAWTYLTPFGGGITPAATADASMSWVNSDAGMGLTVDNGVIRLNCGSCNTTGSHLRVMTAPSTPYTLTALLYVQSTWESGKYTGWGLCFRESGSGKFSVNAVYNMGSVDTESGGGLFVAEDWTNVTTGTGNKISDPVSGGGMENWIWLRITDDGTDRSYWWSKDGLNWNNTYTIGRTNFLTPDQIGIFTFTNNASAQRWSVTWVSWTIT